MKKVTHLVIGFIIVLSIGCSKEEGLGGTSEIVGKVLVHQYNATFTIEKENYLAPDEDVYIIYGNDSIYSDRFSTNHDGTFIFKYLKKGKYTVFVYSDNKNNANTKKPLVIMCETEIKTNGETVNVGTLEIDKN